ncbi:MAG: hypothetical protein ACR2N7_12915, partial [Acidimicrobiia bacterium]
QATEHLEAAIPGSRVDGVIGRSFSRADEALVEMRKGGTPTVLVVALGTNPPMTLAQVDAFMAGTGGISHVVFVNIRTPHVWEEEINSVINSLPSRYDNVSVVDWHGYSDDKEYLFNSSGFHLSDEGKPVFASVVAGGAFRAAGACDAGAQPAPTSAGVGVVDPTQGYWWLRDPQTGASTGFYYGNPGDRPFMGDWDGDGVDTPGLYRQADGYVYLRNTNTQGIADISFFFGNPGDIPVAGDFDGDGFDTVSIYRPTEARFYIINSLGSGDAGLGAADYVVDFGDVGEQPLAADVDGNGADVVGVFDAVNARVAFGTSPVTSFYYGSPGDKAVTAAFGGVEDTVGVFRPSVGAFYLRTSNGAGNADMSFVYGKQNFLPVAGYFGDLPGGSSPPWLDPCDPL